MNKICKNCQVTKDIEDFNKNHAICKKCYNEKRKISPERKHLNITDNRSEYNKNWHRENKEKKQIYYIDNKEAISGYNKKYYNKVKEKKRITYKMSGYIYIIINPAWTDYIKLGRSKNLNRRLYQYQIGSPLRDYELYYNCYTDDLSIIENYFTTNIDGNYEWFKIDKDIAKEIIIDLISGKITHI
jgi:hypothetical protein